VLAAKNKVTVKTENPFNLYPRAIYYLTPFVV
jgi:hypothetical protein